MQEFTEVESGRRNDRPILADALRLCRLHRATLIIAKLDRLARNVLFISSLMESGVEFLACDFPQANRLTVHILAAVAEHEASAISARTIAALAAARKRGTRLGGLRGTSERMAGIALKGNAASIAVRQAKASKRNQDLHSVIAEVRQGGARSFAEVAIALNARGLPSPGGKRWFASSVRRNSIC